jgi:hypothetical protein
MAAPDGAGTVVVLAAQGEGGLLWASPRHKIKGANDLNNISTWLAGKKRPQSLCGGCPNCRNLKSLRDREIMQNKS